ncbi:MAG: hypothetical protein M3138_02100, partial [Actinomycetota bacterium]|nr:hypothetical protein [Actinomycetota bacterium]
MDERRRPDGTVGDAHSGEDAASGMGRCVAVSRVDLSDGLPGLQPVTDLRTHHDTDGGVDGIVFPQAAGAQPDAREPDLLGPD